MNAPVPVSPRRSTMPLALLAPLLLLATTGVPETASAGSVALFDRLDANHDGRLSAHEVPPEHKSLFNRLLRWAGADDDSLSRDAFLAALIPSRPEKPLETKQSATTPQADAIRYLLLTLDTDQNSVIEDAEVPSRLQPVIEPLLERLDRNSNDRLEPIELSRGAPRLGQFAMRYVETRDINVEAELAKLQRAQGSAADRFENSRPPLQMLSDPQQARTLFARLDTDGDDHVTSNEVPEPFRPQLERFLRVADRDGDGKLSEREFVVGARRVSRFMMRSQ